jgi:hypothetical protein
MNKGANFFSCQIIFYWLILIPEALEMVHILGILETR